MKDLLQLHVPTISVAYPAMLLEIAAERGVDVDKLLAYAGLIHDIIRQKGAFISPNQYTRLTLMAAKLMNDQGIGFALGLRMRPTAHGPLGVVMLASSTMTEAVVHALNFGSIRQRSLELELSIKGDTAVLTLKELRSIGWARHFFVEGMLTGSAANLSFLLGQPLPELSLHFDIPEPAYFAPYKSKLPETHFACDFNEIRFPARYLEQSLPLANRMASQEALLDCQQTLGQMAVIDPRDYVVTQVRDLLAKDIAGGPSLENVARLLCVSDRTLKRKLQACGTSFLALQEEVRYQKALRLMANPQLEVQDIAQRLGYLDPANFARAFRRWSGESPSAYMRRMRVA